jgi:hypothetical protein
MTVHSDFPPQPTAASRGAAPVGVMHELPPLEATAILFLRVWCQGGSARDAIAADFASVTSGPKATQALADFDALMGLVLSQSRRTLMRHDCKCSCFGGDESAFANLIAAAALADADEAMLFAATLLKAPAAYEAVRLARALAHPFLCLARQSIHSVAPNGPRRVH